MHPNRRLSNAQLKKGCHVSSMLVCILTGYMLRICSGQIKYLAQFPFYNTYCSYNNEIIVGFQLQPLCIVLVITGTF